MLSLYLTSDRGTQLVNPGLFQLVAKLRMSGLYLLSPHMPLYHAVINIKPELLHGAMNICFENEVSATKI
jgi:hypothetical protein